MAQPLDQIIDFVWLEADADEDLPVHGEGVIEELDRRAPDLVLGEVDEDCAVARHRKRCLVHLPAHRQAPAYWQLLHCHPRAG